MRVFKWCVEPHNYRCSTPQSAANLRKKYLFLHSVDTPNKKINEHFNTDTFVEEQPTVYPRIIKIGFVVWKIINFEIIIFENVERQFIQQQLNISICF